MNTDLIMTFKRNYGQNSIYRELFSLYCINFAVEDTIEHFNTYYLRKCFIYWLLSESADILGESVVRYILLEYILTNNVQEGVMENLIDSLSKKFISYKIKT